MSEMVSSDARYFLLIYFRTKESKSHCHCLPLSLFVCVCVMEVGGSLYLRGHCCPPLHLFSCPTTMMVGSVRHPQLINPCSVLIRDSVDLEFHLTSYV